MALRPVLVPAAANRKERGLRRPKGFPASENRHRERPPNVVTGKGKAGFLSVPLQPGDDA